MVVNDILSIILPEYPPCDWTKTNVYLKGSSDNSEVL